MRALSFPHTGARHLIHSKAQRKDSSHPELLKSSEWMVSIKTLEQRYSIHSRWPTGHTFASLLRKCGPSFPKDPGCADAAWSKWLNSGLCFMEQQIRCSVYYKSFKSLTLSDPLFMWGFLMNWLVCLVISLHINELSFLVVTPPYVHWLHNCLCYLLVMMPLKVFTF